MENFMQDIDTIISQSNNQINDKILGVNYLEKLKYLIVDNLRGMKISPPIVASSKEILKCYGDNDLRIKVENCSSALLKINNKISSDYLCIVLHGTKSIEFHDILNSKSSNKINIFPFTGIVVSKDTIISESISSDAIFLDILNFRKKNEI
jgi:hypothetical protein